MFKKKIKHSFTVKKKIQLISTQKNNPAVCLGFRAIAASISVQILLEKRAKNISKYLPSKTVPALSESVLYGQHLMLLYDLDFCANKYRMLPWEMWCTHLKNCACFFLGNRAQNRTIRMAINVVVPLLDFRASNKCRPYTPRFLCSNKGSSIFVPTRSLFSKLPRKSCPLSPFFSSLCSSSLFFSQE